MKLGVEMEADFSIRTPEGVVFSFELAGPVVRFLAWVIDLVVVSAITSAVGYLLAGIVSLASVDVAMAMFLLLYFVASIGYGVVMEAFWRGQTVGKRVCGLRVMNQSALPLRFSQVAVRNLLRFIDHLPLWYLVGGAAMVLSPRRQRLGDLAAGTVVVRNPRQREPDLEQVGEGKFNSLRGNAALAARLRRAFPPRVAVVAFDAVMRRNELEPAARLNLFRELRNFIEERVELPPEETDVLSDEQLVRNVVEVLFRK